ncbi:ankyrin repeat domain-containing protein [Mycolicibacterium sp. CH28]|uniref:ankyrin repeat domain-containing protein n=1 Tax=Mycolicibacterium sp. CH28 TaxID=2512237 RepID=UPI0010812E3C|nr:ankyrin repeat domain-containing protein [Mycolicibacterium sp. CH28]TGD85551.1 ankyrin repeat domain-containing protein [Mycolicibacterium sp. CH28]
MASTLPDNPSLDRLRVEARALQRGAVSGDRQVVDAIRRHHPGPDIALQRRFRLHDAQLVVARSYGFSGWPALVGYLNIAADLTVDPSGVDEHAIGSADRFCALASLRYDHTDAPPRWQAAADLLEANPDVPQQHVWAAATAADPAALHRQISARPDLANTAGGPFGWVPLLYLCYSRVPLPHNEDQVLAAAGVLLDAGADPNAGYLWRAMATPFTALTGVFGEGEQGPGRQPRHRFAPALAGLLLARGAHPVDHQTLYNRMFRADDSHLELLFRHGLGEAGPSPWERRLGEAMETRDQMWQRQIDWAAQHGFADRLDLLARHGVDVSGAELTIASIPDDPNIRDDDGATALHHAAWSGDLALMQQLLDAGADPDAVDLRHRTTPLDWAEHAYQSEAAELLRRHGGTRESP